MIFTPWLNGERTPVDDHTLRAGWNNLSLATTRAELVRSVLEGVAYNSRWLLATVEKFVGRPFPWLHFIGGGAQSELWCRIMADVLDREIRQVEHPIRANAAAPRCWPASRSGGSASTTSRATCASSQTFAPDRANRAVYDDRYAEFRVLHKQTSRRTKRHARTRVLNRSRDATRSRCARGACPTRASSTGSSSSRRTSTTRCSAARGSWPVHPGVTVVTVFAGNPPAYPEPDAAVGRAERLRARRRRDGGAPAARTAPRSRSLDATPVHLDFVEHTYNPGDRPVAPEVHRRRARSRR